MTVNGKQVNSAYITEELLDGCNEAQVNIVMHLTKTRDVYFGLHLMDELPPPGKRSSEKTISCMSFIHEEYDVKGTAHKEQNLPETLEELLSFLHGLECPPSIIVHSGNGVHT